MDSLRLVLFTLSLLLFIFMTQGIRVITDEGELHRLQNEDRCFATIYLVGDFPPESVSKLHKLQKRLESYEIYLVQFNCQQNSTSCPDETLVKLTKKAYVEDTFTMDLLYGTSAIMAHFLSFCMGEDLRYWDEINVFDHHLSASKGHRDVVLFFTEGLGTRSHHYFVELVYVLKSRYQFLQTTNPESPGLVGLPKEAKLGIWYYKCKEVKNLASPCPFVKLDTPIKSKRDILRFIMEQKYPNVSTPAEDGSAIFDDILQTPLPMNTLYVFSGATEMASVRTIVEAVSKSTPHLVYFVLVDKEGEWVVGNMARPNPVPFFAAKEKYPRVVERFGAFPRESAPSLVMELRNFQKAGQVFVEHWDDTTPFTERQILDFIDSVIARPANFFAEHAVRYGPLCFLVQAIEDYKVPVGTAIGTCLDGYYCKEFNANLRRAVRTLHLAGQKQLRINFVDPITRPEIHQNNLSPTLGYQAREDQFRRFDEAELSYENILQFLIKSFSEDLLGIPHSTTFWDLPMQIPKPDLKLAEYQKLSRAVCSLDIPEVHPVPPSGSDFIPICDIKDKTLIQKNMVTKDSEEDDDPTEEAMAENYDDGEDEELKDEETDLELLAKEEDEVAKEFAAQHAKSILSPRKKEQHVQSLTDKSFVETLQVHEIVIIHFYLPWDARSYRFHVVYGSVANTVAQENAKNPSKISLAEVSCHDWPDVCQKANVTSYPVVKIYINGVAETTYSGLLSESAFLRAVRLYQVPFASRLTSKEELWDFMDGRIPVPAVSSCAVSVFALVATATDANVFSSIARELFGTAVFAYVDGDIAKANAVAFGLKLPSVVLVHREDRYKPQKVAPFWDREQLKLFIKAGSLLSFGEMTEENFPAYHQLSRPYVILFKKKSQKTPLENAVIEMAKTAMADQVFLTWMDEEKSVTQSLKTAYFGDLEEPAVALVHHRQGTVYRYEAKEGKSMAQWIVDCLDGKLESQVSLRDGKWTPLRQGYDYLKLAKKRRPRHDSREEQTEDSKKTRLKSRFQFSTGTVSQSQQQHDEL